jgi:ech hydrogenase subunit D
MIERETQEIEEIEVGALLSEVDSLRLDHWRLVQVLCAATSEGFELDYSFGGGYALKTLRLRIGEKDRVPSITTFYEAAFLYENEIRDLFGAKIERITPDWEGKVFDVEGERPFDRRRIDAISSEGGAGGPL